MNGIPCLKIKSRQDSSLNGYTKPCLWYCFLVLYMKRKHRATLELIFSRPVSGSIKWPDIEALFLGLGAKITEREGSRVGVVLFGEVRVFHRPHPTPDTDKGAVVSIRKWLLSHGVMP